MRRRAIPMAATALFLASCSGTSPAATTTVAGDAVPVTDVTVTTSTTEPSTVASSTSSTTRAGSSTTTEPTSTTTTASAATRFVPPDPFVSPMATAAGGGSGCSPGPGALPDGVWFGFVDGTTDTTIEFDLACFRSCDPGSGVRIGNENSNIRTVPVQSNAEVIAEERGGPGWRDAFEKWKDYEDVGLHTMVWIYINDGEVTHIVQPTVAEGCRFAAVAIDWAAQLPPASHVAFNELGLIATAPYGADQNLFYWHSASWQDADTLEGMAGYGWERSPVAASGSNVGIGAHIHRWNGASWSTASFESLGDDVYALGASGDRVLMSGVAGDGAVIHVLTWMGDGWGVETIRIGLRSDWQTWAAALSGDTFAVSDTGLDTAQGVGTVLIYDWDGTSWSLTATLRDEWDTGMWGSSLDLDAERLVVGADGSTPGPGSRGGVYLHTRTDDGWIPEIVGQGSEGFGFGTRIDGNTIITAAAHSDPTATFWIFTPSADGWEGTPISIDTPNDWVNGLDVHGDHIAVSTPEGLRIGTFRSTTG